MTGHDARRGYRSPLRQRQTEQTREMILLAIAEAIAEAGTTDFSIADVATRAGVSPRTVHRYFPTRQALLDSLTQWATERLPAANRLLLNSRAELLAGIADAFAHFDEAGAPARAAALTGSPRLRSRLHDRRTERMRELLAEDLGGLDEREAAAVFALLRNLMGVQTWYALTQEFGLDGRSAGEAVQWAVQTLVADLRRQRDARADARRPAATNRLTASHGRTPASKG